MSEIEWKPSFFYLPRNGTKKMEYNSSDAVDLTMTASVEYSLSHTLEQTIYFTWDIDWKKLKENEEIEGLRGNFRVSYFNGNGYVAIPIFEIAFTKNQSESIKIRVGKFEDLKRDEKKADLAFVLHLKPFTQPGIPRNILIEKSENLDGILVVEGHKVPVSKSLLCSHSDYFKSLFLSDFKEKKMSEISIEDVKYKDFILLIDFLWLKTSVLTDDTVEGLLELANRFLMSKVMDQIEYFLMNNSKLEFARLFYLAEKFNFENLKGKCIGAITELIHVKILKDSGYFDHFSQETRNSLFDVVLKLIK